MWCVRDFLKTGGKFIYLRRYKTELKPKQFWPQIAEKWPEHALTAKGKELYIDAQLAGYMVPLSTAVTLKSVDFHDVNKIIFDEIFIKKSNYHYLPDEVEAFLDFYETVNRLREDREEVRVFFLSNTISMYNPYFNYFKITNPYNKEIIRYDDILVNFLNAEKFKQRKKESRFGRLISGTPYGGYAIDGDFYMDNEKLIEKKSPSAEYYATFIIRGREVGIWVDYLKGKFYVSPSVDTTYSIKFAFSYDDMEFNTMLISGMKRSYIIRRFMDNFHFGNVRYVNQDIKAWCIDTFSQIF